MEPVVIFLGGDDSYNLTDLAQERWMKSVAEPGNLEIFWKCWIHSKKQSVNFTTPNLYLRFQK
jgi:hypothetical protein